MVEEELRIDPITSQALDRATRLVNADLPLIVSGETGSGKTSFAKTVARRCFGAEGELVFIDCAALNAQSNLVAVFQACLARPKACLVLDRFDAIDDLGQKALLGLLESDCPAGAARLGVIAIAAGNLEHMVNEGRLRADLLHHLNGGAIALPALRNNPDLAGAIRGLFRIEAKALGKPTLKLEEESRLVLLHYHWAGNLRELRTALSHAIALAEGQSIWLDHLPEATVDEISRKDLTARSQSEASKIEAALRYNGGNVSLTACYLGVSRATPYRKIQIDKARSEV